MVTVPKSTQQRTITGSTGQQMAPLSLGTNRALPELGQQFGRIADVQYAAEQRIQRRKDIINSARMRDQFENQEFENYNAFLDTEDIMDDNSVNAYVMESEARVQQAISNFSGSDDARAELEANLWNRHSSYKQELLKKKLNTEREFIAGEIQKDIAPVVSEIVKNPSGMAGAFAQIDEIIANKADVLGVMEERQLRNKAYGMVMENSVNGLIMRGDWRKASEMMEDNPILMEYMPESRRQQFTNEIGRMASDEGKIRREMQVRSGVISEFRDKGFQVDETKALNYIMGFDLSPNKSIFESTNETLSALGINPANATQAERAAAMGIKLPSTTEIDPNKDYYIEPMTQKPQLTPQGAGKKVAPYVESGVATASRISSIRSLYDSHESGNKAAALGVLQGYLKLIDDGAVVRESDIALAESTTSIATRLQKGIDSISQGKGVSDELVEEAMNASESFVNRALEISKSFIDGYQQDTGYRLIDMGIPQTSYDKIFNGVRAAPRADLGGVEISEDMPTDPARSIINNDEIEVIGLDGTISGGGFTPMSEGQPKENKQGAAGRLERRKDKGGSVNE